MDFHGRINLTWLCGSKRQKSSEEVVWQGFYAARKIHFKNKEYILQKSWCYKLGRVLSGWRRFIIYQPDMYVLIKGENVLLDE